MSKSAAKVLPETYPMNGGDGTYSYTKNSQFQKAASNMAKSMIDEAIADKLDTNDFTSSSNDNIFRIADLGCSVGPNTFINMQNILEAVQKKYQSQNKPEFQVFFNDHVSNDFNTLFSSLPAEKNYFMAGVPGSFHGRLFPKSSLHFVHSSIALHWLSKVPEELLDKNSPAWNRGRVHYTNASDEVCKAYSSQFHKDIERFLDARAKEIVAGGMMVLIIPSLPEGIPCSSVPSGVMFDLLGSCLVDMAKDGLISEDEVDSFNLPVYAASAKEMTQLVQRNGCFSIERMELLRSHHLMVGIQITMQALTMHLRAGFEGIISKHFGSGIVDELFVRFHKKIGEFPDILQTSFKEGTQLVVVLKLK